MATARDIMNFLLPWNHTRAGNTYKMPEVEVINTSTGEKTTLGGNTYTYETQEQPTKGTNTMTTGSEVNNAINDYNEELRKYNEEQLAWAKEQFAQQQTNFETELKLKQQQRADTILENETTRQREDTYYQRMIKDLAQAGINPLMAGQLSGAGVKMGTVANGNINMPGAIGLGTAAPQSQAGALATVYNATIDKETNDARLKLDKEIADRAEKHESYRDQLSERERIDKINETNKQISLAFQQLRSANINAGEERKLKERLSESTEKLQKYLQQKNIDNQKELAEERNKLEKIKTGNEQLDIALNTIVKLLGILIK